MDGFFNFDWRTYFEIYPDLGKPGRLGRFFAYWHYRRYGWREGRCFPRFRQPEHFPEEKLLQPEALLEKLKGNPVPTILCIDVEPDSYAPPPGTVPGWLGAETAVARLPALRRKLADGTGHEVSFNWFWRLDPQIATFYGRAEYPFEKFERGWRGLVQSGDELAVHTHCYRYADRLERWTLDYGDAEWVDECIATGFSAYRSVFGKAPHSHRFGDRWLSDRGLALIHRLGACHDLTLEPGYCPAVRVGGGAAAADPFPDMRGIDLRPYPWDGSDFRCATAVAEGAGLWLLPLSSGPVGLAGCSRERALLTLNLGLDPRAFRQVVNNVLVGQSRPLLAMVVNTSMMTHPLTVSMVEDNLVFLAGHPVSGRLRFVTPGKALEMLGLSTRLE